MATEILQVKMQNSLSVGDYFEKCDLFELAIFNAVRRGLILTKQDTFSHESISMIHPYP